MQGVVLIHAFPLDSRMWRPQVDALRAEQITVLAPDLRGFGAASAPPFAASMDEHADDLRALIERERLGQVHLVGLSLGGYVALAFAKRHATLLSGIVLADTRAAPDAPAAREARDVNIAKVRAEGPLALLEGMLPKLVSKNASPSLLEELRTIARDQPREGMAQALAAMRDREDLTHVAEQLDVHATIIVGSDDVITPKDEAQALAHRMKDASYVELAGAGHLSNLEQSHAFSRAILAHLRT
jgi:3-oxoadipate enol-lactonase